MKTSPIRPVELRQREKASAGQNGIALLMVMWVLTILSIIVFSFAYMTKAESQASLAFKRQSAKKFLAEAGIERGIMEIFYRKQNLGAAVVEDGKEVWKMDGTPYKVETENGYFEVMITDESGKLDINNLNDASAIILKNLLVNSGVEDETANTIVDSIQDWVDPDDLVRLNGAEDDYYKSLPNPYSAKNGSFDTLEELLLVKGVTPHILYGDGKKKGIMDFLTVNPKPFQPGLKLNTPINLTAAPREILQALPGIGTDDIAGILTLRENPNDPANAQAIGAFINKVTPPCNSVVTGAAGGNIFTIQAVGREKDDKNGYGIKATITTVGTGQIIAPGTTAITDPNKPPYTYLYYKSPAEVRNDNTGSN